jgi:hypothetical protein
MGGILSFLFPTAAGIQSAIALALPFSYFPSLPYLKAIVRP